MFAEFNIDVSKINKDWLYTSPKTGKKYLKVIVKDAKNSQYGDDYMMSQGVPKEERDKGTKYGPILSGGKEIGKGFSPRPPSNAPAKRQTQAPGSPVIHEDDGPLF